MFEVKFYKTENGESPVEEFVSALDEKMQAKFVGLLEVLEEKGTRLREPYSKHLKDGIFELRCQVGNNHTRVLYFFYHGKNIILTNGFIKKTQKTPASELRLAKKRRSEFLERVKNDENVKRV